MRQLILILTLILLTQSSVGQGLSERHPDILSFMNKINRELTSYEKVIVENEDLIEQMTNGGGE